MEEQTEELWVIVAAAGESRRMGLPDGESKQFLLLGGEPILSHSVRRLLAMPRVDGIVVVLHPSHTVRFANELLGLRRRQAPADHRGRRTRCDSVRAGLLRGARIGRHHRRARRRPAAVRAPCVRQCLDSAGARNGAVPGWRSATP